MNQPVNSIQWGLFSQVRFIINRHECVFSDRFSLGVVLCVWWSDGIRKEEKDGGRVSDWVCERGRDGVMSVCSQCKWHLSSSDRLSLSASNGILLGTFSLHLSSTLLAWLSVPFLFLFCSFSPSFMFLFCMFIFQYRCPSTDPYPPSDF